MWPGRLVTLRGEPQVRGTFATSATCTVRVIVPMIRTLALNLCTSEAQLLNPGISSSWHAILAALRFSAGERKMRVVVYRFLFPNFLIRVENGLKGDTDFFFEA